jgi:hypothetical protein
MSDLAALPRALTASHVKALVLTSGVTFTDAAITYGLRAGAKTLQQVYNAPARARASSPQELQLTDADGYSCVVSAVSPVPGRRYIEIDVVNERLTLSLPPSYTAPQVEIDFVKRPAYYGYRTASGIPVTRFVSACGMSEMNIWPWHDCAIGRLCRFCGVNTLANRHGRRDLLSARSSTSVTADLPKWLDDLRFAVTVATDDAAYARELFPMIISGNLPNDQLELQAQIYAQIAAVVVPLLDGRAGPEGLVATTVPSTAYALQLQRDAGIATMAINLEAYTADAFRKECPGKDRIGRDIYQAALIQSVSIFGRGRVWTNLVLGLEPIEDALIGCKELSAQGITTGASILHYDQGATTQNKIPPAYEEAVWFYRELATIYGEFDLRPHFSSLALRSSLANEAFDGRL